jgi:hypothetical protein
MQLRRFLLFASLLCAFSPQFLFSQSASGTIPSTGGGTSCVLIDVTNKSTVGIQVTGTWSGTLQPQISIQGQAPQNIQVTPYSSSTAQSTITANGNFVARVGGGSTLLLCGNTVGSGTANVWLNATQAVSLNGIGSGGAASLATLLGGSAPAGQTYDFNANADVVNVVTQAAGDSSVKAASDAFVSSAIVNSQQAQVIAAHNYGVKGDGKFRFDVTTTLGSNAISCTANDCNFTNADDGKICFATNASRFGQNNQNNSIVVLPQGVFTHTGTQAGTCSGGNATASQAANALFVWGSDDSAALAAAWAAALAACGTLQLPGVTPGTDGPAVMLVQSAQLNQPLSTGCFANTGGSRNGIGVRGVDINSTYIIPTPNFDFTSGPTISGVKSFFLTATDGINISDLTIWGAGISNPAAGQTAASIVTAIPANNAAIHHLTIMGWGSTAGANGIGFGLTFGGNDTHLDDVDVDGAGQTACHARPVSGAAANVMAAYGLECWDTPKELLWVDGQSNASVSPFFSIGGDYGGTIGSGSCAIGITGGGYFTSIGDAIGFGFSEGNGVCAGQAQGGAQTGAGFANIDGDSIWLVTAAGGSQLVTINTAGNYMTVQNTRFAGSAARSVITPFTSGTFIRDNGGNTFNATGPFETGSGIYYGNGPLVLGTPAIGTPANVTPVTVSTSTTADQNLMTQTLVANQLNNLSRNLHVQIAGIYSTPVGSTATISLKVKLCTVSGCGSGTVITPCSWTSGANPGTITNNPINATCEISTQTVGATAAFEAHGNMVIDLGASPSLADTIYSDTNTGTVGTIDATGQLFLQVSGAFSAASASNSMSERQLLVSITN